eukprot:GHVU01048574.1.p1 GENE.GHVU01048574.1~~GHVU01048574.1.p1  ORF type:complete len:482 (+),score=58.36 GHVU01048574.1:133-1578(+)
MVSVTSHQALSKIKEELDAKVKKMQQEDSSKKVIFTEEEVRKHDKFDDCWIIIKDHVFDVTGWMDKHPGGADLIQKLGGKDATEPFYQHHLASSFVKIRPFHIGMLDKPAPVAPILQEFRKFSEEVEKEGYYVPSNLYVLMKFTIEMTILAISHYCFIHGRAIQSAKLQIVGAVFLATFLQQVAFLGHDAGHGGLTAYPNFNFCFGVFVGNICSGVSLGWWNDTHNHHHVLCNVVQHDPDIQHLPFLAVTTKLFNSLYSFYHKRVMKFDAIAGVLIPYQHYFFYPLMAVARFNLYIQSIIFIILKSKYKKMEILGMVLYWTWIGHLLSYSLSWRVAASSLLLSHIIAGVLHVQIVLSHFAKEVLDDNAYVTPDTTWVDIQLRTTMDIDCPRWMRWFHGGLQHQTAHHLFPRVPRCHLTSLRHKLEKWCKKNNRVYDHMDFISANYAMWDTVRQTAYKAAKKPKGECKFSDSKSWEMLNARG